MALILEKLHILTALFAGLVFTVAGFVTHTPLATMAPMLLGVLFAFFVIGLVARSTLKKALIKPEEPPPEEGAAEAAEGEGEGAAEGEAAEVE